MKTKKGCPVGVILVMPLAPVQPWSVCPTPCHLQRPTGCCPWQTTPINHGGDGGPVPPYLLNHAADCSWFISPIKDHRERSPRLGDHDGIARAGGALGKTRQLLQGVQLGCTVVKRLARKAFLPHQRSRVAVVRPASKW